MSNRYFSRQAPFSSFPGVSPPASQVLLDTKNPRLYTEHFYLESVYASEKGFLFPLTMEHAERCVEAILFAGGEAVETERMAQALELEPKTVEALVQRIRERYINNNSPLDILLLDGAYQMCTMPQYAAPIRAVLELRRENPLSQAALEVLAVVAYNQPVTRAFVDQVRGVDCAHILRSLVEKGLIEEAGRLPVPGKPLSYRTTSNFLRCFGLTGLEQLPSLPDLPAPATEADQEPQLDGQIDFFEDAL